MDAQTATVVSILGCVVLIALRVMRTSAGNPRLPVCLFMLLLGLGATNLLLEYGSRAYGIYPKTESTEKALSDIQQLKAVAANDNEWFVLIDGASRPVAGLDLDQLAHTLRQSTNKTLDVIGLFYPAADYFERIQINRMILDQLSGTEREHLAKKKSLYLREFQWSYDHRPLTWFYRLKTRDTDRAYAYLSPGLAWDAFYATYLSTHLDSWNRNLPRLAKDLIRHALVYANHVGFAHRFKKYPAPAGFSLAGFTSQMPRFRTIPGAGVATNTQQYLRWRPPQWLSAVRDPHYERLWGRRMDYQIFFTMPSKRQGERPYSVNYCHESWNRSCILPWRTQLLHTIKQEKYWKNNSHVNALAVPHVTSWFAQALLATGVFQQ